MEQKHNDHYGDLNSFMNEAHEKNKKRLKSTGIVIVLLPVVLGLIRWLTGSDKIIFLFIWILCMFILSAYLVSVEYLDYSLQKRIRKITGNEEESDRLLDGSDLIPEKVREAAETKAEGGDE